MYPSTPIPPRLPQRVIAAGPAGPALTTFLERLAELLDVPLVPLIEVTDAVEAERLASFDGWLTTSEYDGPRPLLLDRAELVVHVTQDEPGTIRGLVRRTVRKIRADEPDLAWLEALPVTHPELPVLHLAGATATAAWLAAFSA